MKEVSYTVAYIQAWVANKDKLNVKVVLSYLTFAEKPLNKVCPVEDTTVAVQSYCSSTGLQFALCVHSQLWSQLIYHSYRTQKSSH